MGEEEEKTGNERWKIKKLEYRCILNETKGNEIMSEVIRVKRTKNFTVMSNHHFKNKELSLKAKGLLSLMLSLPDDWNYSMKGLATLSKDGIDSVRTAMKELENQGYVTIDRDRNEAGCYQGTVYTVREVPKGKENN